MHSGNKKTETRFRNEFIDDTYRNGVSSNIESKAMFVEKLRKIDAITTPKKEIKFVTNGIKVMN